MNRWPSKGSTTSWREAWRALAGTGQPPLRTAVAIGLGVVIGVLPVMPFQTALALAVAFLFRLNRIAVWTPTLVWQPFTMPFIVGAEVAAGRAFVAVPAAGAGATDLPSLWAMWGWPLVVGSLVVAPAAGLAAGALSFVVLRSRARQNAAPAVSRGGEA